MTHKLKTWPSFFQAVKSQIKPFEIRENDRNFQVGDTLVLEEFSPCPECKGTGRVWPDGKDAASAHCDECDGLRDHGIYTGDSIRRTVSYITDFGQTANRIVMGLSENDQGQARSEAELPAPPCSAPNQKTTP